MVLGIAQLMVINMGTNMDTDMVIIMDMVTVTVQKSN